MSEYTRYFAVKSSSEGEVQNKLRLKKVKSVVDADRTDFWFAANDTRNGIYNWVVVSAPADAGFDNDQFYYRDQFEVIGDVFETMLLFFQAEDFADWRLKIKVNNTIVEKKFSSDEETVFGEADKNIFTLCFDKRFEDFQAFLQPGKAADFLNYVGIPYMEMNDQDKLSPQLFGDKFSLLADELTD